MVSQDELNCDKKEMQAMLEPNQLYSVRQLARILHIAPRTLYYMVKKGKIPYIKITEDSYIQFAGWQIQQWLDTKVKGGGKT